MSEKYKFNNPEGIYLVTSTVVFFGPDNYREICLLGKNTNTSY